MWCGGSIGESWGRSLTWLRRCREKPNTTLTTCFSSAAFHALVVVVTTRQRRRSFLAPLDRLLPPSLLPLLHDNDQTRAHLALCLSRSRLVGSTRCDARRVIGCRRGAAAAATRGKSSSSLSCWQMRVFRSSSRAVAPLFGARSPRRVDVHRDPTTRVRANLRSLVVAIVVAGPPMWSRHDRVGRRPDTRRLPRNSSRRTSSALARSLSCSFVRSLVRSPLVCLP